MIRAAITIGSNSTRMLCAAVENGQVTPIRHGREETRLFLGLDENGNLTPEAVSGCVAAVTRLKAEALLCGAVEPVRVYATSATRDARNQSSFLKALEDAGCPVRVLSGREEAALAFKAAAENEDAMVVDIGGGSTELIRGDRGVIRQSVSMQLGASRLYRLRPINSVGDLDAIRDVIKSTLDENEDMFSAPFARTLFGIGGTLTSLAAISLRQPFLNTGQDNVPVPFSFLKDIVISISTMPEEARLRVTGIPPTRVRYIPHGLAILEQICLKGHFDTITVRTKTNLNALLAEF